MKSRNYVVGAHLGFNRLCFSYFVCVSLIVSAMLTIVGCSSPPSDEEVSDGIELTVLFGDTQNGVVYDRATLDTKPSDSYVFPEDAVIETSPDVKSVEIYLAKVLHYVGHPRRPPSVYDARKAMGLAYQVNDHQVVVATYGEWDTRIEGGDYISLGIRLPERVTYTTRAGLAGPESEATGEREFSSNSESDVAWGASTYPRKGWTVVKTVADPSMTAKDFVDN